MGAAAIALGIFAFGNSGAGARTTQPESPEENTPTKTPIKHVIVILAENRSFDEVYGTFIPRSRDSILNLRTLGIVNADGTPGPNFSKAAQFTVSPQPHYYVGAPAGSKTAYTTLPPPDLNGVHSSPSDTKPAPFATVAAAQAAEPALLPEDAFLLTTGASGLPFTPETTHGVANGVRNPDTRILHVTSLPNGPYQQTARDVHGNGLPYDAYTEDTIHRFYQMWQQSDCAIANASVGNPTGCLNDLYPFVITTFAGLTEEGMGTSMSFYNLNQGDARVFRRLAEQFTLSDNYHQGVMGGTGVNHIIIGAADMYYFNANDGTATPTTPPPVPAALIGLPKTFPAISLIANPDPQPNTNNVYVNDIGATLGEYMNCNDPNQPGAPAIVNFINSLPYKPGPTSCAPNTFYAINNFFPPFHANGVAADPAKFLTTGDATEFFFIPRQTIPTIGDALNAKGVSWKYYGGGYNDAISTDPVRRANSAFCPICNPMQYSVNYPANQAAHTRDILDLFNDVRNDTLPSVSIVKPSGFTDGHPQSSKLNLFEALLDRIVNEVQENRELFKETAILVTFDESGGMYDSGFIQIVDAFGDGPRVPMLVISPYSRGGKVDHTYTDHASIPKFIEANWFLSPLSGRSRDNLPNPTSGPTPYVPGNMPAIGDLMTMFRFPASVVR